MNAILRIPIARLAVNTQPSRMGMKYQPTDKDNKLNTRYHVFDRRKDAPEIIPGARQPKKLTKREAARLAAKNPPPKTKS